MALQDILNKILEDAKTASTVFFDEAKQEMKAIDTQIEEDTKNKLEALSVKTEEASNDIEEKTRSMARRENAKKVSLVKQELVEKALSLFLEQLESCDEDTYGKILTKLFASLPDETAKVLVPGNRLEITKKLAPKTFEVAGDDSVKGGFIVTYDHATVDNSFRSLVFSEYREPLQSYFAQQLKLV